MINEEFLKEQGIDETKHKAILSAFNEATKGMLTPDDLNKQKGDAVRSMMEGFENSIFEATKIQKNNNEKASEYAKRAFEAFHKTSYESKINELSGLNKELNDKIKAGIKDPELVSKIEALEQTLETERTAFKEKEQAWESENTKREKLSAYKSLLPKFKDDIDSEFKKFKIDGVLNELLGKEVVEVEGKLIIKGDETNGFTNTPVEEYFKESFKSIIDEKIVQNGTGLKPRGQGDNVVLDISDNDSASEKEAKIRAYLKSQGINSIDSRYSEEFTKLRTKYVLKK